jgi:hypothetical protein
MKELPNEKKLDELLSLTKDAERQAKTLYELAINFTGVESLQIPIPEMLGR